MKREQTKNTIKGQRFRKSHPEALIAVKLVKKAQKKGDRSPSRVSVKSAKSKKSTKS